MPLENGLYVAVNRHEEGRSPPVLLIHGAGGNHLSWPSELRRLPGQDVYAVDLPGHGRSGGPGEQTLGAYADRLSAWMDSTGAPRMFVLGHSMGGGIALEMAHRHTHRVAGLGLFSSGARLPIPAELVEATKSASNYDVALKSLRGLSFSPSTSPRLVKLAMRRLAEVRPSVLHNDFLACQSFDASGYLDEIHLPTLVVCGSQDGMAPLRRSQFLVSRIGKAELRVMAGAGHMAPLEKPGESAGIVGEFLRKMRRGF